MDMLELRYKELMDRFINEKIGVDEYIGNLMDMWKQDRGQGVQHDPRFGRMIDRVFTSTDCYNPDPKDTLEITADQLKEEVRLLSYIWWG